MRLWSIHPRYLDRKGLVALWREALLAEQVLKGKTKGYDRHPQLQRLRNDPHPEQEIADYMVGVWKESKRRGHNFDDSKIGKTRSTRKRSVTSGQLRHEFDRLLSKLRRRDPSNSESWSLPQELNLTRFSESNQARWSNGKMVSVLFNFLFHRQL